MKARILKQILVAALLTAGVFLGGCADTVRSGGGIPERPDALGYDEISFSIPEAEQWQLPNGLKVYYYLNDELPQMRGIMYFPGGSLYEENGIAGLSSAAGAQMREGAVPGFSPEEFDKYLDTIAASIESSFGEEYGSVQFYSLEEDFDQVFSLFAKVVREPSLNQKRLDLWKALAAERIRRRRDNPSTMASMTFRQLVYGEDSAYSKPATYESISQINLPRIRAFLSRYVRPDGARLAITGSLPKEQVKAAINEAFGNWQPGSWKLPELPQPGRQAEPGLYVLERDFDQATIVIGHRGPPRHTPDQYGMKIFNQVFGAGGFSSILFREIRSRLGLAYSVYGGLWPDVGAGTFQMGMQTRNEEAARAIKAAIRLAREGISELPVQEDFRSAKSAEERSFVFKFAKPDSIVDRAAVLELLGYPKDYDETFLRNMEQVEREELVEIGQRWVEPNDFVIVVVGRVEVEALAEAFQDEQLKVREVEFDTEPKVKPGSGLVSGQGALSGTAGG